MKEAGNFILSVKVKVKQTHNRPGLSQRVPGGWGSQISRQSAHEGGKVVSPTHRPPLPPGNILDTHFCYWLSEPQGHSAAGRIMSKKNSNDTIGNRTRDLQIVAQCLNKLSHRVPLIWSVYLLIMIDTLFLSPSLHFTPLHSTLRSICFRSNNSLQFIRRNVASDFEMWYVLYRCADKSLARPGRKQTTATKL